MKYASACWDVCYSIDQSGRSATYCFLIYPLSCCALRCMLFLRSIRKECNLSHFELPVVLLCILEARVTSYYAECSSRVASVQVMEAAQSSTQLAGRTYVGAANINHIAHLSGALVGVLLIWLLNRIPLGDDPSPKWTAVNNTSRIWCWHICTHWALQQ